MSTKIGYNIHPYDVSGGNFHEAELIRQWLTWRPAGCVVMGNDDLAKRLYLMRRSEDPTVYIRQKSADNWPNDDHIEKHVDPVTFVRDMYLRMDGTYDENGNPNKDALPLWAYAGNELQKTPAVADWTCKVIDAAVAHGMRVGVLHLGTGNPEHHEWRGVLRPVLEKLHEHRDTGLVALGLHEYMHRDYDTSYDWTIGRYQSVQWGVIQACQEMGHSVPIIDITEHGSDTTNDDKRGDEDTIKGWQGYQMPDQHADELIKCQTRLYADDPHIRMTCLFSWGDSGGWHFTKYNDVFTERARPITRLWERLEGYVMGSGNDGDPPPEDDMQDASLHVDYAGLVERRNATLATQDIIGPIAPGIYPVTADPDNPSEQAAGFTFLRYVRDGEWRYIAATQEAGTTVYAELVFEDTPPEPPEPPQPDLKALLLEAQSAIDACLDSALDVRIAHERSVARATEAKASIDNALALLATAEAGTE